MSANEDPVQGRLPLQPSNVDSNEEFPEFCLHASAQVLSQGAGAAAAGAGLVTNTSLLTFNRQRLSSSASTTTTTSTTSSSRASYSSTTSISSSGSTFDFESSPSSPESRVQTFGSSSPTPRNRRDKQRLHAARLQRSSSNNSSFDFKPKEKPSRGTRFQRSFSSPADALAAVEPPHDQGLTRMAFADQQRWVTVQQKTFTKWYAVGRTTHWAGSRADVEFLRLNTKIEERNLEITDLVADLSDGVSDRLWTRIVMSQC